MTRKVLVNLVILFGLAGLASAKTIYVPGEDYAAIQYAIDDPCTVDGDIIVVGQEWADPEVPEVYVAFGNGNRDIDFKGKAITVRSRYGPEYCVIDCEGTETEPHRGFRFHSGETETSVVQGFTIKNGYAGFGGAIECAYGSSPKIRDCIIYNNHAVYYGGGIECYQSSPEIFNCIFYNNIAANFGGAIDCEDASPKILNCNFDRNHAETAGGGIFSSWTSTPQVLSCIFTRCSNYAIYEYPQTLDSDLYVMTCLFYENHFDRNDENSELRDYYDADTDSWYTGSDLGSMPEPPGEKFIFTVYPNNPRFVTGPASYVLEEPLGKYYLSQTAAGQPYTSICVNNGQWLLSPPSPIPPNPFVSDPDYTYTTRTDNVGEDTSLDVGYHYRASDLEPTEYLLVTEIRTLNGAEGTIEPNCPSGCVRPEFITELLTADPNEDSIVSFWGGGTQYDGTTGPAQNMLQGRTSNSVEITADNVVAGTNEIHVIVEFDKRPRHKLSVTHSDGGTVRLIAPEPVGGTQDKYYEWEYVKLEAIPDDGYVVKSWSGNDTSWAEYTRAGVYMYQDRNVHVEFISGYVELTVVYDASRGTVHPRGGRYPYPAPGQTPVTETLEVYPMPGYRLDAYRVNGGDWITWHNNSIDILMDDDKTVEVWFEPIDWYWLYTEVLPSSDGLQHGWIEVDPPSGQTSGQFYEGRQVRLLAHPEPGYIVGEWFGVDSSDPNGAVVTVLGPTTVSARFVRTQLPGGERICVYAPTPEGEPDWSAGPKGCYPTIQDAIDAAESGVAGPFIVEGDDEADPPVLGNEDRPGDIVVVADGVYTGPGNRDLNFRGKLITVRSELGPQHCIIDCGGTSSDPHRAFVFAEEPPELGDVTYDEQMGVLVPGAENNGSIIDGFTIINGYADTGAGISIGGISAPLLRNCIIGLEGKDNYAVGGGGGVYFSGLAEEDTSWADLATAAGEEATAAEEEISDPGTDPNGDPLPVNPADLAAAQEARLIATVLEQIADFIGGDEAQRPTLTNCRIQYNNTAYNSVGNGGGIFCTNASPIIISTEISNNKAGERGLGRGGGVYCEAASLAEFINCLVVSNTSSQGGGGFQLNEASGAIIQLCTVADNSGGTNLNDGIVCDADTTPTISHCIVYHAGNDLVNCTAEFSLVGQDPMFVTGQQNQFYSNGYYLSHIETEGSDSLAVDLGDGDFLGTLQQPPQEEGGYGLPFNLTTSILDRWSGIPTWDIEPTDAGFHYPFHETDIRYNLTMYVIGNGTLNYEGRGVVGTVTADTSGVVESFAPGTPVILNAEPESGYRVRYWYITGTGLSFAKYNFLVMYTLNQSIYSSDRILVVEFEEVYNSYIEVPGEFPYIGIQDALDAARDGDTLVIAPGTYRGTGFTVNKNITITGTEPSNPDVVANTVIDCAGERWGFELFGDDGTLYGSSGHREPEVVLAGISIINAHSGRLTAIDGQDPGDPGYNGGSRYGQGVTIIGSHSVVNCVIRNCTVLGNHGGNGVDGGTGEGERPTGGAGGNGGDAAGAGIYVSSYWWGWGNSPVIKNCIIDGCVAEGGNGGDAGAGAAGSEEEPAWPGGNGGLPGNAYGAGIYYDSGTEPTFIDCTVKNCIARGGNGGNGGVGGECPLEQSGTGPGGDGGVPGLAWGGGVYCGPGSAPIFTGLTVSNCQAIGGQGGDGADAGTEFGGAGGYGGGTSYDPAQDKPVNHSASGGGVYCGPDSAAVFANCRFENNTTTGSISGIGGFDQNTGHQRQPRINYNIPSFGGGVYCAFPSSAMFMDCVVRGNETTFLNDQYTGYGGGLCFGGIEEAAPETFDPNTMQLQGGEPIESYVGLTSCDIADNASPVGGGIYVTGAEFEITDSNMLDNSSYRGGGMYSTKNVADISRCTIRGNMASQQAGAGQIDPGQPGSVNTNLYGSGGGLYLFMTDAEVADCVISRNDSGGTGGGVYLGGSPESISADYYAAPKLKNCLITDNTAFEEGAGVSCNFAVEATISNCTISGNKLIDMDSHGGGLCLSTDSIAEVIDSIIWGNRAAKGSQLSVRTGDIYYPTPTNLDIIYSDIGPPYGLELLDFDEVPDSGSQGSTGPQTTGAFLVESDTIYEQLNTGQGLAEVIVSLVQPAVAQTTDWSDSASVGALRAEISTLENTVLGSLAPGQFTLRHQYTNQAAFSANVTIDALNSLLDNPLVYAIEPVRYVYPMLAQAIPLANASGARQLFDGSGISVAIVDTGVDYTHPRLGGGLFPNSKVIGGYDTGEDDDDPMAVGEAHGTCCAGISAGDLGTVGDYIGGVAPGAKIYALKAAVDNSGSFFNDDTLAAWDWCVTHRNDDPANPLLAISNSWGIYLLPFDNPVDADNFSPAHTIAAQNAVAAGITILASSGNDGYAGEGISWPSAMSNIISVGAVYDTTDEVTGYSNTAGILDILAPADPVYTTDIVGPQGYDPGDYFPSFNGTSSACPFAAGSVAGLQHAAFTKLGRYLPPDEVRNILVQTGDPVTDTKVDITKPRVNVGAAIGSLEYGPPVWVEDGGTLNGQVFYDFDPNTFRWDPAAHNIQDDPLFVGEYFLSQIAAGQLYDSNCVDAGSDPAVNLGLDTYTTRTDSTGDEGIVDMGYHHELFTVQKYRLTTRLISTIGGAIDPNHPTGAEYDQYTVVPLRIWPTPPPGYRVRWTGTDDDRCTDLSNTVTMDRDRNVTAEYEQYWYTLKIVIEGPGRVTADSNSVPYNDNYPPGAIVRLTADPNAGYKVRVWRGADVSPQWGGNTARVTMNRNRTVTVEFVPDVSDNLLVPLEYPTIEEAMAAASSGDRIILQRQDTPHMVINPDGIDFGGRAITIMSENPEDPNVIAETVIDCAGSRYSTKRAFHFHSGEGHDSRIWGITIKNGFIPGAVGGSGALPGYVVDPDANPPVYSANNGENAEGDGYGGAILCENGSSPTIEHCVIMNCTTTGGLGGDGADGYYVSEGMESTDGQWGGHAGYGYGDGYGGAIACLGKSNPLITRCTLINNKATGGRGGRGGNGSQKASGVGGSESRGGNGGNASGTGFGGAVYADGGSSPLFVDCIFRKNAVTSATAGAGGMRGPGDALDPPAQPTGNTGSVTLTGATAGGAVYYRNDSDPNFVGCTFTENEAYDVYTGYQYVSGYLVGGYGETSIHTRGGAVYCEPNNVVNLRDCSFSDHLGGAVYCQRDCELYIGNCDFSNNQSVPQTADNSSYYSTSGYFGLYYGYYGYYSYYGYYNYYGTPTAPGGAVYAGSNCKVDIENSTFASNYSHGDGGAINLRSDAILRDCSFGGNRAGGGGGAIAAHNPDTNTTVSLDLEVCSFGGNESILGGALYLHKSDSSFSDCYFVGNKAQSGGGLFLVGGNITLSGGLISENEATGIVNPAPGVVSSDEAGRGGGLASAAACVTIRDCEICRNTANGDYSYGGGISFYGGSDLDTQEVKNCLVTGNKAEIGGGGISCRIFTSPYIANCTFSGNSAGRTGGGIFSDWTSEPRVTNSIFANCKKYAVYEDLVGDNAYLEYSLFYDNSFGDFYDAYTGQSYIFSFVDPLDLPAGVSNVISGNPLFANGPLGSYYLSQLASGQPANSPAVDGGNPESTGFGEGYTTRTDGGVDEVPVDIGYHYSDATEVPRHDLKVTIPTGHGLAIVRHNGSEYYAEQNSPAVIEAISFGTKITIEAYPDEGYRIGSWSGGTINDRSRELINDVIITSDKTISVIFEQPRTLFVGTVIEDESHYTSIQHAVDDAVDGDVVVILPGEYIPSPAGASPYDDIRLYGKDITLTTQNPDNPEAVVLRAYDFYVYDTGPGAIIEGFTVTGGQMHLYRSSPVIRNCIFRDTNWFGATRVDPEDCGADGYNGVNLYGGAIDMYGSSPTILNCIFRDMSVTGGNGANGAAGCEEHPGGGDGGWPGRGYGGAVYCAFSSNPTFIDCLFADCYADGGTGGNGGAGNEDPDGHGGRGGGWEYAPSIEEDLSWWYWWDGWTYGDHYYLWYTWGYYNYDWETWGQWFDTSQWNDWAQWYADYSASNYTYGQITQYYDAYEDYWEYSGYGGAVYCEYDSSPKFDNCVFENNYSSGGLSGVGGLGGLNRIWPVPGRNLNIETAGGAVYAANGSNPEFMDCLFVGNTADPNTIAAYYDGEEPGEEESIYQNANDDYYVSYGGAVACEDGCMPKFTRCRFRNNESCQGGAVYIGGSNITMDNCTLVSNTAYQGAGMQTVGSSGLIRRSTLIGNTATFDPAHVADPCNILTAVPVLCQGGGYCSLASTVDVRDSVFKNNYASASGGGIYYGGSDENVWYAPALHNCLLTQNTAVLEGAGVSSNWFAEPVISNSTIADNQVPGADGYGGGLYCSHYSNATVIDSVFWGNASAYGPQIALGSGSEYEPRPSTIKVKYSDIAGGENGIMIGQGCYAEWGTGNIDADPCFAAGPDGDYYLSQTDSGQLYQSPCVDAGSASAFELGLYTYTTRTNEETDDGDVDIGYHYPLAETVPEVLEFCSDCDIAPAHEPGDPCRPGHLYGDGFIDLKDFALIALYWYESCESDDPTLWWCPKFTSGDYSIHFEELAFFAGCWLEQDNQGPEPDPSEWETLPHSISSSEIKMTAKTATDQWGWPVEYYFANLTNPAHDSGWQSSSTYTDSGLTTGTQYCYKVKTRDKAPNKQSNGNETAWSEMEACATVGVDEEPPAPVAWLVEPYATSDTSISMTAQTATDASGGVQYYFEETSGNPGGADSGWQNNPTYEDTGLSAGTTYRYRFMVRDSVDNQSNWSTTVSATTDQQPPPQNLPPYPDGGVVGNPADWDPDEVGGWSGEPRAVIGGHYMRADAAVDPEGLGVEYYFDCVSGEISDSGWQTSREWIAPAPAGTHYCYSVKYRDTSAEQVQSAPSSTLCVP
ncbi:MAG TPA: S8 family serine peptidase [Planctomycetes bacterium]|nr:S8 family serine peptidase [Planctomycetota bacterium]HIJ71201.1 S8 family serine peptidase [Planctomycetota bacterium]